MTGSAPRFTAAERAAQRAYRGKPAEPEPCDHAWSSHHEPGHALYWVRQCMVCHQVDWDDLDRQIADL